MKDEGCPTGQFDGAEAAARAPQEPPALPPARPPFGDPSCNVPLEGGQHPRVSIARTLTHSHSSPLARARGRNGAQPSSVFGPRAASDGSGFICLQQLFGLVCLQRRANTLGVMNIADKSRCPPVMRPVASCFCVTFARLGTTSVDGRNPCRWGKHEASAAPTLP